MPVNFISQFSEHAAARWPERTALIAGSQQLTFAALHQQVLACSLLLSQRGLKAGERVVLASPKQLELVVMILAVARLGAVVVPVHAQLKPTQLAHVLQDCQASMLMTNQHRLAQLTALQLPLPDVQLLMTEQLPQAINDLLVVLSGANPGQLPAVDLTIATPAIPALVASDVAAIMYTSGSTGLPKGVVLSQQNLMLGTLSVCQYLQLTNDDVLLALLPFSFDYGFNQLLTALYCGASLVLLEYLLPQDVVKAVVQHQVTGLAAVPPLWSALARANWGEQGGSSLRFITNSGGSMPQPLLTTLQQIFPYAKPYLMYGLTEAFRSSYLDPSMLRAKPGSIGKAIPFADLLVLRPDGSECAVDEPGELVHRGPLVSLGYWNDQKRTNERFRPDPVQPAAVINKALAVWSGDEVRRDADGYLYYLGRLDEMLKCSGFRISPAEVEQLVYQCAPQLYDVAAIGVPFGDADSAVLLLYCCDAPVDEKALLALLRQQLPHYMCPKALLKLAELPKTANGKLDRKSLRLTYKDFFNENA
ncbi:acyl-CoA ligase (AMP-forming), exosortase A system-associated [Rheinheimera sp. SA_1]|uniref:acyl-CoA ligase (AMP-forming), exosortase A system-associated n=1 Tax=Rheinheimera sp. SA_1 TaxID=1827365 RepID=UPI0007FCFE83|nr:acyl-CoA ligase (AMP-forming), exosortase A system-associated [Rheinheimera sp. SA_1]OBP14931.1 acyl-CoA ligase (AMP-forming), exosortase A system-associated [Rheinheimera sp. SA_1]